MLAAPPRRGQSCLVPSASGSRPHFSRLKPRQTVFSVDPHAVARRCFRHMVFLPLLSLRNVPVAACSQPSVRCSRCSTAGSGRCGWPATSLFPPSTDVSRTMCVLGRWPPLLARLLWATNLTSALRIHLTRASCSPGARKAWDGHLLLSPLRHVHPHCLCPRLLGDSDFYAMVRFGSLCEGLASFARTCCLEVVN